MTDHSRPTSEWEYSHALNAGDVVEDTDRDDRGRVQSVASNGGVWIEWDNDGKELYTERGITRALADGLIQRDDGLSHELATF